ncbi:ComEC/Rec2 family competence protein [Butyrivibrio sp. XPD2006]|uniref:ComEC/Rec2 family competence protein n=1 Tax=Butyrivibrio sp. XPD2006 TaxID=1280668 RepID=UPI0003B49DA7|nr:MBL fold metallo-hydrolase [Butyrivibrio sp. XPD2006]
MRIRRITGLVMALLLLVGCGRNSENINPDNTNTENVSTASADASVTITCISGDASDAFVLIGENHVTVIDTGLEENAQELVDFLKEQGVTKVDNLIITHFDKDHVGGADHVINSFDIGTVYTTYKSKDSDDIASYLAALNSKGLSETIVSTETSFEADGVSYDIYPPQSTAYENDDSNNSSLVIMVSVGESNMLFAGDAEKLRINELLALDDIQAEILKVPHHGRYEKNTEALIQKVSPEYAIITSSVAEPEDPEVTQILENYGVTTYLNREGNITITMSDGDISITQ